MQIACFRWEIKKKASLPQSRFPCGKVCKVSLCCSETCLWADELFNQTNLIKSGCCLFSLSVEAHSGLSGLESDSHSWELPHRRVLRLAAASSTTILILAGLFHAPLTAERSWKPSGKTGESGAVFQNKTRWRWLPAFILKSEGLLCLFCYAFSLSADKGHTV